MSLKKVKLSKFLSFILRHDAVRSGLNVENGGWILIQDVLDRMNQNHADHPIKQVTRDDLDSIVMDDIKQRYSIRENYIRANQGHTFPVDLEIPSKIPPDILYHGTYLKIKDIIMETGIKRMQRHHVHLTESIHTAKNVGQRRGKPIIFKIDAKLMHQDGIEFRVSENGVWLVDFIHPKYISILENT